MIEYIFRINVADRERTMSSNHNAIGVNNSDFLNWLTMFQNYTQTFESYIKKVIDQDFPLQI